MPLPPASSPDLSLTLHIDRETADYIALALEHWADEAAREIKDDDDPVAARRYACKMYEITGKVRGQIRFEVERQGFMWYPPM